MNVKMKCIERIFAFYSKEFLKIKKNNSFGTLFADQLINLISSYYFYKKNYYFQKLKSNIGHLSRLSLIQFIYYKMSNSKKRFLVLHYLNKEEEMIGEVINL